MHELNLHNEDLVCQDYTYKLKACRCFSVMLKEILSAPSMVGEAPAVAQSRLSTLDDDPNGYCV